MNKSLFSSAPAGQISPNTDTVNAAGGIAYDRGPEGELANLVLTGTLNTTFYVNATEQLSQIIELCSKVSLEFVAKLAVYARSKGFMKDTPAVLLAWLAAQKTEDSRKLLTLAFPKVIDNGKMLRNFVQAVRSNQLGRKSFGSHSKRLIAQWLESRRDDQLFNDSVGQTPSINDIIKMVHPKAVRKEREALYGYLIGRLGFTTSELATLPEADRKRSYNSDNLPRFVKQYEAYKVSKVGNEVPNVDFRLLSSLDLDTSEWTQIAKNANWHTTRMNLNTFQRHGVFADSKVVELIANKLKDPESIRKSKVFPYQIMQAFQSVEDTIPHLIKEALQDAMEIATENVPTFGPDCRVVVCPDVSGSMKSPVTGNRGTATSKTTCVDVAALVTAVVLRQNRHAVCLPFEIEVKPISLNPRDSVMTNAQKLASLGGGGTAVSAPFKLLNTDKTKKVDLVIVVSDNASWADVHGEQQQYDYQTGKYGPSQTMIEWNKLKVTNPKAKLVIIDIQPGSGSQVKTDRFDILSISGWNDTVFEVINQFHDGSLHGNGLVKSVETVVL